MYHNGWGVDKNDKQALTWYLKVAKQGNVDAQFEIGKLYQRGLGLERLEVPYDSEAVKWFKKAAKQGHPKAAFKLGVIYENSKKYKKAYRWYEKAAEKGYKKANYKLGWMNDNGLGVERNIDIALYYYRESGK